MSTEDPTINGAENVAPVTDQRVAIAPEVAQAYQDKMMAVVPGLIGAIDIAFHEQVPEHKGKIAFVLFTVGPGGVVFANNMANQTQMRALIRGIVVSWDEEAESGKEQFSLLADTPAANEQPL